MQKIRGIKIINTYLLSFLISVFVCCSANASENTMQVIQSNDSVVTEDNSTVNDGILAQNNTDTIFWNLLIPTIGVNNLRSYEKYKVQSKNAGEYFNLIIGEREYRLLDVFDYGEMDVLVYKFEDQKIILIGAVDFYGSTYYVYYLRDGTLSRLGDLNFSQPLDVEEKGMREVSFIIKQVADSIFISIYLDKVFCKQVAMPLNN